MIKSNAQLRRAQVRLAEVRAEIESLRSQYSGIQLRIYTTPRIDEIKELETEIKEFQELLGLSLEEAVQGPLGGPILLDNIGELLAKLRIAAGLSQRELAHRIGWQQSNLSRFESENYYSQTIAKVVEYADSLGTWLHVSPSLTEKLPDIIINSPRVLEGIIDVTPPEDTTDRYQIRRDPEEDLDLEYAYHSYRQEQQEEAFTLG